jgi:H/ACA ribonucleoprotein complex subunit 4
LRDALAYASELGREEELRRILRPVEDLLSGHRKVVVKDSAVDALCHGAALHPPGVAHLDPGIEAGTEVALMTLKGEAIGVGRARMTSEKMATASRGVVVTPTRILMAPSTYPRGWKGSGKSAPSTKA